MNQQPLNILVVDDDVDNATSLGELLEMEGHQVHVVHSGEEAVRVSRDRHFNISFMDVVLPGLNGVESFLQIRRTRPDARVYMMTGYSVEQLLTQALKGGALGVLEKPFDPEAILQLTSEVGPSGLVLAEPAFSAGGDAGQFIRKTFVDHGIACRHVTEDNGLQADLGRDEVLLLDMPNPLIDSMQVLQRVKASGHTATTVMVPHARNINHRSPHPLLDVAVTGILNKPFDPLELLNKLPQLAA
jgi:two-component system, NtrC family, response regulator HydG